MVGERENIRLPVYFQVPSKFTIVLSRQNIIDSFFLSRVVDGYVMYHSYEY